MTFCMDLISPFGLGVRFFQLLAMSSLLLCVKQQAQTLALIYAFPPLPPQTPIYIDLANQRDKHFYVPRTFAVRVGLTIFLAGLAR